MGGARAASAASAMRVELARKSIHITSAAVPVAYAMGAPRSYALTVLGLLLLVAVAVEVMRARWVRAGAAFTRWVGVLLREREAARWTGATWMLAAFVLAVALFPRAEAVAAMWAVSVGDASAAVVGRWLGRRRFGPAGKSVEGSLALAAATFAGALLVARLDAGASAAAAISAALAEFPTRPLDDNIRVALATGFGILLWRMAFY